MIYLTVPPVAKAHRKLVEAGELGVMLTPRVRRSVEACHQWPVWAADNACFTQGAKFDLPKYLAWLTLMHPVMGCLFATAPDVLGDADATWERSRDVLPEIRLRGYKAALVIQNGIRESRIEWDALDAIFIGGDNAFKSSREADAICAEARRRGKWTHMGRVNTEDRARQCIQVGYDSSDGTFLAFGPDANLPRVRRWIELARQTRLFAASEAR